MSRSIITLTTDFGLTDSYVAQMKGIMLGINPEACLVDVTHAIPAQNVVRAAAILREVVESFPPGTIHVAVIDPGVGGSRSILAAEIGDWRFIAPDNGLLSEVSRRYSISRIFQVSNSRFWRASVSHTFHGRDIMAPVAAHWSLGVDASEFGPELKEPKASLPEIQNQCEANSVRGRIIWSDHFGNLVTSIPASQIPLHDRDRLIVECGNRRIAGIHTHYAQVDRGGLIALIGSSGYLEIAVREGSASALLNCDVGETVTVFTKPAHLKNQSTRGEQQDKRS